MNRIFYIKKRDLRQTLPWFVSREGGLARWGSGVPDYALRLAERFWPGALTLVVRADEEIDPEYLQAADPLRPEAGATVALRAPGSDFIEALLDAVGTPLAQTSANLHGRPAAASADELDPAIIRDVDLVVDGGPALLAEASTIVDCTGPEPRVLRAGAIDPKSVLTVAGE